jgi:hypothetical protein
MKVQEIRIPKGTKRLSDEINSLPKNCLFDKGLVGCGGTHLAIRSENRENTIVCVPFVSLIENKVAQKDKYPNLLGVHKDVKIGEIKEYLSGDYAKRVLVTYDSIERIMKYINPKEYDLLVDEYHLLFTQYAFRSEAARKVLRQFREFRSYCFMTATEIDSEFILKELKNVRVVRAVWEEVKEVKINSVCCSINKGEPDNYKKEGSVDGTVEYLIKRFLDGGNEGNAYIFVNSIEFIKSMIENCGLTSDNCRVIYSRYNKTQLSIERGSSLDAPKKINFLTSTCFEGADIYDTTGKVFIVSDNRKRHTLTDISTSFQQIAKRIRNSQYNDEISHIFTETRYNNGLSYNEFKREASKQVAQAILMVEEYNRLSPISRRSINNIVEESYVIKTKDNDFLFDENLVNIDLYNFKVCHHLYKLRINVEKELSNKGFNVVRYDSNKTSDTVKIGDKKLSFKDDLEESLKNHTVFYWEYMYEKYDWLEKAIEVLGLDLVSELSGNVQSIKREMLKHLPISDRTKVMKYLKSTNLFGNGDWIESSKAKELIEKAYNHFNIKSTANIKDLYVVKDNRKWIDGKTVRGYVVVIGKLTID